MDQPFNSACLKRVFISLLALSLCTSGFVGQALAEDNGEASSTGTDIKIEGDLFTKKRPPRPTSHVMAKLGQTLQLSQEQKASLEKIQMEGKSKAVSLKSQLSKRRQEMLDYLSSTDAREEKANQMQHELAQLQEELSQLRITTWFQMRKILTPQQLETLSNFRARMMKQRNSSGNISREQGREKNGRLPDPSDLSGPGGRFSGTPGNQLPNPGLLNRPGFFQGPNAGNDANRPGGFRENGSRIPRSDLPPENSDRHEITSSPRETGPPHSDDMILSGLTGELF